MNKVLLSRTKGAQFLRKQIVDDIVCGYYWEEDALIRYNISANRLIAWMRKFGFKSSLKPQCTMAEQGPISIREENKQLKEEVDQLRHALKDAQMKNAYYDWIVKTAEKELGIDIEKKYDSKQYRR